MRFRNTGSVNSVLHMNRTAVHYEDTGLTADINFYIINFEVNYFEVKYN